MRVPHPFALITAGLWPLLGSFHVLHSMISFCTHHCWPVASSRCAVCCKFRLANSNRSLRFTGYEPCALASHTRQTHREGAVDLSRIGLGQERASCVNFLFCVQLLLICLKRTSPRCHVTPAPIDLYPRSPEFGTGIDPCARLHLRPPPR